MLLNVCQRTFYFNKRKIGFISKIDNLCSVNIKIRHCKNPFWSSKIDLHLNWLISLESFTWFRQKILSRVTNSFKIFWYLFTSNQQGRTAANCFILYLRSYCCSWFRGGGCGQVVLFWGIELGNKMSIADNSRGMNTSDCKSHSDHIQISPPPRPTMPLSYSYQL